MANDAATLAANREYQDANHVYVSTEHVLQLGVRPDTTLAKSAGIEIGERGGMLSRAMRMIADSSSSKNELNHENRR